MNRRRLMKSSGPADGRKTIGDYEVVDLGLPSGLLWATCNVWPSSETSYGDYYMYGYGRKSYDYDSQGDDYYNGTENPLYSSVDTATQVMGKGWRMPTRTEFQELVNNTYYEWTTIDGVNGGKFKSRRNANAYVFFPAAGFYDLGDFYDEGDGGYVWSSTPNDSDSAYNLYFYNGGKGVSSQDLNRFCGYSVRGVHAAV